MPDQNENASERPNAGQETACCADGERTYNDLECEYIAASQRASSWWKAAKALCRDLNNAQKQIANLADIVDDSARSEAEADPAYAVHDRGYNAGYTDGYANANRRADAAEAKLKQPCGSCHPCVNWSDETWRREGRKPPHFHQWQELRAERAAALSKLDAITDHAGSFHAAMLGPAACNPDSVRVRAVAALDGIRDVITGQGDFTAITRERRTTTEHEEAGQ